MRCSYDTRSEPEARLAARFERDAIPLLDRLFRAALRMRLIGADWCTIKPDAT